MLRRQLSFSGAVMSRGRGDRCTRLMSGFSSYSEQRLRASLGIIRRVHVQTNRYSSHGPVGRGTPVVLSGEAGVTASAAPWECLVRLVTGLPLPEQRGFSLRTTVASAVVDAAGVDAALPEIRELWMSAYHPVFCCAAECHHHSATATAAAECGVDARRQQSRLLPEEAVELPLFVQALGHLAAALQRSSIKKSEAAAAAAATGIGGSAAAGRLVEVHEWLAELQALLLLIGQHHLRFLIPATCLPAVPLMAASPVPEPRPADGDSGASDRSERDSRALETSRETQPCGDVLVKRNTDEVMANHTSAPPAVVKGNAPGAPRLRRLSRRDHEHLEHMAPPLPVEELLRVVVLVEAARTILDVAHPPPLASRVRAEVYSVLLSVVGASEQLPSTALASLTTCLARCVDSYATCQQLSAAACASPALFGVLGKYSVGDDVPAFHECVADADCAALPSLLRRVSLDGAACATGAFFTVSPSPMERHEAVQLERLRGGLSIFQRPAAVLHHLRVLASVVQRRLAKALYDAETGRNAHKLHQGARSCGASGAVASVSSTGAARVAKEARMEAGMLGMLTLEQRKARTATATRGREPTTTAQPRRKRRTVAEISAAAERERAGESNSSADGRTKAPSPHVPWGRASSHSSTSCVSPHHPDVCQAVGSATCDPTQVSFTDLAEVCSAMAAIGFRGDDTAAEEPMWRHAVEFACAEIATVADARDSADMESRGDDGDAAGVAAAREAVIRQTLLDARDVCFALDRIGYARGYDRVMAALVRCGFLREPIAAPSAGRRAMKNIPS
ncbi:hypothetical protein CUR178_03865 [Leishmania enriettii]|uniref:Uncharacterized protein n=1 Tax=Leishmania enriettii TaxID=5663 RepID=A0A836KKV0_LEIEN|nr:hypothetical protein CUR178_03865 [Leishmania enriettii]